MSKVVEDAQARGAKALPAASASASEGNFFAPTILADVPLDASVFNDEPFGPVAAVRGFDSLEEAINEANRLPFGLAGYAFTRSIKNAHQLMNRMEVGMLWINQPAAPSAEMPFGGIKDSGYGSEGGPEALEAYLNTKAVSMVGEAQSQRYAVDPLLLHVGHQVTPLFGGAGHHPFTGSQANIRLQPRHRGGHPHHLGPDQQALGVHRLVGRRVGPLRILACGARHPRRLVPECGRGPQRDHALADRLFHIALGGAGQVAEISLVPRVTVECTA
jgi:hypothetical protein